MIGKSITTTHQEPSEIMLYEKSRKVVPFEHDYLLDVLPIGSRLVLLYSQHLVLYDPDNHVILFQQPISLPANVLSCSLNADEFVLYFPNELRLCIFQTQTLEKTVDEEHRFLETADMEQMVYHLFSFEHTPLLCLTRRHYINSNAHYFDHSGRSIGNVPLNGLGLKFDEEGRVTTYSQNCRERIQLDIYSNASPTMNCSLINPVGRNVMVAYLKAITKEEFLVIVNDSEAPIATEWVRSSWMIGNIGSQLLRVVKSSHCIMLRMVSQTPKQLVFIEHEVQVDCNKQYIVIMDPKSFKELDRRPLGGQLLFNMKQFSEGYFVGYGKQTELDCDMPSELTLFKPMRRTTLLVHLLLKLGLPEQYGQAILPAVLGLM